MTVEDRLAALHDKAARLAFRHYLRSGRVPREVREVLAATESLAAVWKFNPYHDDRGRFTFAPGDRDWFDPANPPGYVDFWAPDDKPLEQVYIVEAVALLVVWEAVVVARIVAGLTAPLVARVARSRRINQAMKSIEEFLGGKPASKDIRRNPAGDLFIIRGDKKR